VSASASDRVERVLVAVDATLRSDDALAAAVEFASAFGAPLTALFVEDVNLVRLSELPFATELDRTSGVIRPLNPHSIGRALQTEAQKLEKRLREESKKRRISISMQVVRGHYVSAVMQMARRRDIVFFDDVIRQSFGAPGGTLHPRAREAPQIWQRPVWVLYDGSKHARRALRLAAGLSGRYDLDVVVLAAETAAEGDIEKQIKKMPVDRRRRCAVIRLSDEGAVAAAARKRGCAALILPREAKQSRASEVIGSVVRCPRILV
jgi:nucleotide-binding universal stress UspA family protein